MRWIVFVGLLAATSVWAWPVAEDMLTPGGAPISLTGWGYRKKIEIKADGVQQLVLDLETLARAVGDLRDMRIIRDGQQFPYVTEHADKPHRYAPIVDIITDAKRPTMSMWKIRLPAEGAPVTRLVCQTRAPLFDRNIILTETTDEGRRFLGSAHWVRTPRDPASALVLSLSDRPVTASVTLEMDNGDNPGIALEDFQCEFATDGFSSVRRHRPIRSCTTGIRRWARPTMISRSWLRNCAWRTGSTHRWAVRNYCVRAMGR